MKLKKLLLFSLSLVFALSLTFGLGGAFKAFAADGETGPKLFTGARVTLTEDIVTKFEYTAPAGYTSASYTFTYMGETTEAKTATIKEGENTIEFAEANPARIGKTITANLTLTGKDKEPVTDTCEFSVADYLGTLLTAAPSTFTEIKTQEQYVAMRTLAANLVNYSAKTQEYIGLADTSSALLTTETVKNFVGSVEPNGTDATVGTLTETDKYGFLGASLLLDGRVSVCFYFVAESTENLSLEIAFDGGSNATLTEIVAAPEIKVKEGVTAYKAVLEGIPAIDMDKKFTAKLLSNGTAVGNEVTYSVKSYAHAMLSSDNAKMKSLATAIYNYGLSAKSYVEVMAKDYSVDLPTRTETLEYDTPFAAEDVANMVGNWRNPAGKAFAGSLTTDGEYLYALAYKATATATNGMYTNSFNFVKFDTNGNQIAYSQEFDGVSKSGNYQYGGLEYYTPLWIKDGYAYSYNGAGKTIRIATASLTTNGASYEEVSDIKFGTAEPATVNAVVYSATQKKYVVLAGGTLAVYAENDLTTPLVTAQEEFNRRITVDDKYVYVTLSGDGTYSPTIYVKGWDLVNKTNFSIKNDAKTINFNADNIAKTKTQGITICNGQFYYQLIEWVNNKTTLLKTTKQRTVNDYSVGEILNYTSYSMTAENVTNGWNNNTAELVLNAVQKNDWVYSVRNVYGTTNGYLVRYNYLTNKQVAVSTIVDNIRLGSEDSTIFTYGDKVYLYDVGNKQWLSLPLLFNTGDELTPVSKLPINLGDYATNFENIHVFEDLDLVAVYVSGKIVVLKDGAVQATYMVSTAKKNRMGGGKNGYLYYTVNEQDTLNPTVIAINIKNDNKKIVNLANSLSNVSSTAITSIFELNGMLCYTMFTWNGGIKSCMQAVKFSDVNDYISPYKELGEIATENKELSSDTTEIASIGGTVKGVVTDGTYLYMANCTTTGKVKILKTTKYGGILGQTAEFNNGVDVNEQYAATNDQTYLLYKDGYVYAFSRRFTSIYRAKASDITADGTCEVAETTELAFKKEDGAAITAHAMAYDEKNDRYAIRNGSTLYLVDGKTMKAYKTVAGAVGGTQVGVASDENYVYALYEKTGGLAFVVYDWSGNKVKDVAVAGFIGEEPNVANIPSMIIEGGKVYIFAKPWQGAYGSNVFIYTIDLNKLAG